MELPKLTSKDMHYENKYGWFFLSFEYSGANFSTLKATLQNESRTVTYTYEYSTDLFEKYIVRYLTDQINAWKTSSVFYAEKLVLDFYNEVLTLLSI